ncbi:MAG: DUF2283 domain-containing protein [Phormidium tanganyikae FI6-MK23]|nr:DUF2283 domain-containing protein [Phormidium tanganyikae FI6-MK23]
MYPGRKTRHSPDVDALLIEVSDEPIFHAEEEGQMLLHYSENDKLVLIEILDVQSFMTSDDANRTLFNQVQGAS